MPFRSCDVPKTWMARSGGVLISLGVGVWGVYAVGKYLLGWDIFVRQVLPYHLAMIIPGMLLRHNCFILQKTRRFLSRQ